MNNLWKKVLCILLVASAVGGILLIANSDIIKENLLPFAKQLAEDIMKNIDWSQFDIGDADQYLMANYDIKDGSNSDVTSSSPFVWFRGYSNSDFSDKSNSYSNNAITATKKTSNPLTFYAEKIDATINNGTFDNTSFKINVSLRTEFTTAKLNNTKMIYLLDPVYCDDSLSNLSDDNKKRSSETSSVVNYSTTIRPYYDHELAVNADFEDETIKTDEQNYYNDIKEKYLNPLSSKKNDVKENLKKYLKDNNLNPVSNDINSIMEVKDFLNGEQFTYVSDVDYPTSYSKGSDAALYFLNESKKGDYDLFSWAICELYRANDIPARTCSGFIGIGGKCYMILTHTWTEVYVEGSGWVKVDASIRKRFIDEKATNISTDMPTIDFSNLADSGSYTGAVDDIIRAGVLTVVKNAISSVVDSALSNNLISNENADLIKKDDELVIRLAKEFVDAYEDGRELTYDYLYNFIVEYFKEKGIDVIGTDFINNMTVINPLPDCFYPEVSDSSFYDSEGNYYKDGRQITYGEYYTGKPDELTDEEWSLIEDEDITDKRTKITLEMKDCAKIYEGEDLLPDWESYAEIQSVSMYIEKADIPEWAKTSLSSILTIKNYYNFNDTLNINKTTLAALFSQYNFTWSDLNSYLSYSMSIPNWESVEDEYINKEFIFNLHPSYSAAKLDIHYPNIAPITKENYLNGETTSSVPAMITCRDTSKTVDEDHDGEPDIYADGSTIYKDITDRYYNIVCVDDKEYSASDWSKAEEDEETEEVYFEHYKTFTAYSRESQLTSAGYSHMYTINTESSDISVTLDEVNNGTLDELLKKNQPKMTSGHLLYSDSDDEDYITFTPTVDKSIITKKGNYLYSYNALIENDSGVTRYDSDNYISQLYSIYNVSTKFGLIKVR